MTVTPLMKRKDISPDFYSHRITGRAAKAPDLYIRERRLHRGAAIEDAVLFVHGATISSILFDIPVPGHSWMAHCALHGLRAFAVDIRGYGRSGKPSAMNKHPMASDPVATLCEAVEDINAAVNFVGGLSGVERVHLVGGSWGSVTCGAYAADIGKRLISKLVLYAPLYAARSDGWLELVADPNDRSVVNAQLGAYREVTRQKLKERWDADIAAAGNAAQRDDRIFEAIFADSIKADAQTRAPLSPEDGFRVPNGTLVDLFSVFSGSPLYDARKISAPTVLIRGSDDATSTRADALGLFDQLGACDKRYIEISNAGHFASAEARAKAVFRETQSFLSEEA